MLSSAIGTGLLDMGYEDEEPTADVQSHDCTLNALRLLCLTPGKGRISGSSALVKAVRRIQMRAAQIITGAFRATAGDAVDVEAHLLSAQQQLEQTAREAAMRARTTPMYSQGEL
jgi:hypothetical protein